MGTYNPDWAIAFNRKHIKHIYFVIETKGSMNSLDLKGKEAIKVECAKKFFEELNKAKDHDLVHYEVADSYESLMSIIS